MSVSQLAARIAKARTKASAHKSVTKKIGGGDAKSRVAHMRKSMA